MIYTFPSPASAIEAALSFENDLDLLNHKDINIEKNIAKPFTVRIGITTGSITSIPIPQRGIFPDKDLDTSGHLKKHCPPGKILLSRDAYEGAGTWKRLFRYGPPIRHGSQTLETFVSATSHMSNAGTTLSQGLSDRQKDVLPVIPFPRWEDLKPDLSFGLPNLHQFFETDDLLVILGETRTRDVSYTNVSHPAATSDAVAVTELICSSRTNRDVIVGIDEWEDIQDYAADRNIVVVGSGITNIYAYMFNDIIEPLRFARDPKEYNIIELIVTNERRYQFGHHGLFVDDRHSGLLVVCNNPFNIDKKMLWMAGITGIATSASARLAADFMRRGSRVIPADAACQNPIACVVGGKAPPHSPSPSFWARWRVDGYSLKWMIDARGTMWCSS